MPSLITAVVLAAGQSRRMGRPKQLETIGGEPMVVRAVRTALAGDAAEVLVITGAYADRVAEVLRPLQAVASDRLRVIANPQYASGQASSVRTAIQALDPRCEAVLFLLVDQPFVTQALLQRLIAAWRAGAPLAASMARDEVRGAPAIFDRSLFPELLQLTGDTGARPLLQRHREKMARIPATADELRDIDTPDDLAGVRTEG
ncbi:MAG: nucleotidyltransferase family protein [Chloroflexi bacterium]|nr:MAG: nucleotidyltransferase family protein [Chloroflexota bacterium]